MTTSKLDTLVFAFYSMIKEWALSGHNAYDLFNHILSGLDQSVIMTAFL